MQNIDEFVNENKNHKFDFCDTDTHALRELKTAAQRMLLRKYIVSLDVRKTDESTIKAVYIYTLGITKSLTNVYIFRLREKIQPAKWYTLYSEPLPSPTAFKPLLPEERILTDMSVGHMRFRKMVDEYGYSGITQVYGFSKFLINNLLSYRISKKTGIKTFKTLPSYSVIRTLKDVISPDLWYIFPEELEE